MITLIYLCVHDLKYLVGDLRVGRSYDETLKGRIGISRTNDIRGAYM